MYPTIRMPGHLSIASPFTDDLQRASQPRDNKQRPYRDSPLHATIMSRACHVHACVDMVNPHGRTCLRERRHGTRLICERARMRQRQAVARRGSSNGCVERRSRRCTPDATDTSRGTATDPRLPRLALARELPNDRRLW
jgi:hypothetical protein